LFFAHQEEALQNISTIRATLYKVDLQCQNFFQDLFEQKIKQALSRFVRHLLTHLRGRSSLDNIDIFGSDAGKDGLPFVKVPLGLAVIGEECP